MCEIGVELYPSRTPEIKIKDIKNISQLHKHSFINVITGSMTGLIGVKLENELDLRMIRKIRNIGKYNNYKSCAALSFTVVRKVGTSERE